VVARLFSFQKQSAGTGWSRHSPVPALCEFSAAAREKLRFSKRGDGHGLGLLEIKDQLFALKAKASPRRSIKKHPGEAHHSRVLYGSAEPKAA
jgi:hypothetical protein